MTVVYIDSFLVLNFSVNFLLLLATARLTDTEARKLRIALAAALGAGYALLSLLPDFRFFLHPAYKIGMAVLMAVIAFGGARRLLRLILLFFALACGFSGGLIAIQLLSGGGGMTDGVLYSTLDVKEILLIAALCYGILTFGFRRMANHGRGELVPILLRAGERELRLTALRDSGNTLTDPLTGRSVLVAEGERFHTLFPDCRCLTEEALRRPIQAMSQMEGSAEGKRFRLLPYRSVGVDCGMLLAVRLDSLTINGVIYQDPLAALSPNPVSDGGGYSALLGSRLGEE